MKVYLKFNLPEEREEYEDCVNGVRYRIMWEEVWEKMFRPYHKHGFSNERLNKLLETEDGKAVFEMLEQIYQEIRSDRE